MCFFYFGGSLLTCARHYCQVKNAHHIPPGGIINHSNFGWLKMEIQRYQSPENGFPVVCTTTRKSTKVLVPFLACQQTLQSNQSIHRSSPICLKIMTKMTGSMASKFQKKDEITTVKSTRREMKSWKEYRTRRHARKEKAPIKMPPTAAVSRGICHTFWFTICSTTQTRRRAKKFKQSNPLTRDDRIGWLRYIGEN